MANNSTKTYDQIGIREDLSNVIYNVDPTETPFLSNAPKNSASNTLHEWQTDTLDAVEVGPTNKALEGEDAGFAPATATVRLGNYTQISQKTAMISGTNEATDRAGRDREMAYQVVKRAKELKRDMETVLVGVNAARVAGSATVEREAASMQAYIASNDDFGATGASPTGDGTDARTDGTQRPFAEADLEAVVDLIWNSGGDPDILMVGSFNKRAMNAFTGIATSTFHDAADKSIIAATDVYVTDYGDIALVPNRFSRSRDCLVYQKDMWAVTFLRNMNTKDIAKTGDADKKQILVEYTLESRNEKSSGAVYDLNTA